MAADRTLISIRERRQVDLLDLALVVVRRRPLTIGLAAGGGVLPFLVLNAWRFQVAEEAAPALALFLWWFEAPLALAPLTVVLGGMMFGRTPAPGAVARRVGASAGTLVLAHGLFRFIPLYWLPPRLMFANEMILLEHSGPGKLWKRGADLGGGRDGDLFLFALFQALGTWATATFAYLAIGRLMQAVLVEKMTWALPDLAHLAGLGYQLLLWACGVFMGVVRFLTYIDQRIRLEGWEIKLRLHAAGEAMGEGRRW